MIWIQWVIPQGEANLQLQEPILEKIRKLLVI